MIPGFIEFETEAAQTLKFRTSAVVFIVAGVDKVHVYLKGVPAPVELSLNDYIKFDKLMRK